MSSPQRPPIGASLEALVAPPSAVRASQPALDISASLESDRKDNLIASLHTKVAHLATYKEKAAQLERSIESAEAHSRQREAAHAARAADLQARLQAFEDDEARIAGQIKFLEDARLREADRHRAELASLRSELASARAQGAAAAAAGPAAQSRVRELEVLLDRAKEREDAHLRHTSNLQKEVASLRAQLRAAEADLLSADQKRRASSTACTSAKASLQTAQSHIERLEATNSELAAALGQAKGTIAGLEDDLAAAKDAAATLPDVTAKASRVPLLAADLASATSIADGLRAQNAELERRLSAEQAKVRASDDAVARLSAQIDDLTARYVRPLSPTAELAALKSAHEDLALRAAAASDAAATEREAAATARSELSAATRSHIALESSVVQAVTLLQAVVQSAVSERAHNPGVAAELDALTTSDALAGDLGPLLSGLHTRVGDLVSALDAGRAAKATLELQLDSAQAGLRAKESDLVQAAAEAAALAAQVEEREDEMAQAESLIASLDKQLADLSAVSAAEAAAASSRLLGLHSAAAALGSIHALADTRVATDVPPHPEWDAVIDYFSSAPAVLTAHLQSVHATLAATTAAAAAAAESAESSASALLDKQAASLRAMHEAALADVRDELHVARRAALDLESQLGAAQRAADTAASTAAAANAELAEARATSAAALAVLSDVVRAYRAARLTNLELAAQKRFLASQSRQLASVTASVHSLRMALVGQLDAEAPEAHDAGLPRTSVSFRSAAIAVIAMRRLAKLGAAGERREGRGSVVLAPLPAAQAHESRVPLASFVRSVGCEERSPVDTVVEVLRYFDGSGADEELHFSPVLLASLASGQVGHAWWRAQVSGRSEGPVSDLAMPAGRGLDPVAPLRGVAVIRKTALDLICRLQAAEADADSLTSEFAVLETAAATADEQAAAAAQLRAAAERRLEVAKLEITTLESKMATMVDAERLQEAEAALAAASKRLREREERLAECRSALDARTTEAGELDANVQRLTARIEELSKTNLDAQEKTVKSERAVRQLEDRLAAAVDAKDALTSELHDAQMLNTRVQTELVGAKAQAESQAQLHARVAAELDATRATVRQLEADLAAASATASVNATQMLRLNTQVEEARAAAEAADSRARELERSAAEAHARSSALEASVAVSRDHAAELHREAQARQARLESASRESASYQHFRALLASQATAMGSSAAFDGGLATSSRRPVSSPPPPGSDTDRLRAYVADLDAQIDRADTARVLAAADASFAFPSPVVPPRTPAHRLSESLSSALSLHRQ